MKAILQPFTASILVMCITILHFSTVHGQGTKSSTTLGAKQAAISAEELATPLLLLAPQKGVSLEISGSTIDYTGTSKIISDKNQSFSVETSSKSQLYQTAAAIAISPNLSLQTSFSGDNSSGDSKTTFNNNLYTSSSESKGLSNPKLGLLGRSNLANLSLIYGAEYTLDTGSRESEVNGTKTSSNNKYGGGTLNPSIILFNNSKSSTLLGVMASYRIAKSSSSKTTDVTTGKATESSSSGGNSGNVSLLLEQPISKHRLGCILAYEKSEDSSNLSVNGKSESSGTGFMVLGAYGSVNITKTFSLLPMVAYGQVLDKTGRSSDSTATYFVDIEKTSYTLLTMKARMTF